MNISLTGMLKEHALARVEEGTYTSVSDYIRNLIRLDMEQANKLDNLCRQINGGRERGKATPLDVEKDESRGAA